MIQVILFLFIIACAIWIVCPVWAGYKLRYLKRQIWTSVLHRCPRCNCKVNFDRHGRAHCPDCGRPC